VPFTRAAVPEIDIEAGWLSIDPPGETEEERPEDAGQDEAEDRNAEDRNGENN